MNIPDSAPLINFTLAAALKVKSLIDEEGNPALNLRVFITGGGCSGFQYGFSFDENINDDDIVIEKKLIDGEDDEDGGEGGEGGEGGGGMGSVKLLIDAMSFQYLQNAEIDYREDVERSEFVIRNPQAKTTCGCGSSFSV
jgi:iron-sulfur cluster insertion protein